MKQEEKRFYPVMCVTHDCNLSCVYCYQKHRAGLKMSFETGKTIVDWIFNNVPPEINTVEIQFIGGEPLLEFELIKNIVEYTLNKETQYNVIFFASTNGTVLTDEMKSWFINNNKRVILGLSLDGDRETHNHNRCNSFDSIDFDFFKSNWPKQGIKMTLSEYSLSNLAHDIKYLHSLGINDIKGVNLFEGEHDWSDEKYIKIIVPQLKEIVDFYVENPEISVSQLFDKRLDFCEVKNDKRKKWCGIGDSTVFFDVDGKKYPCTFITPMTFSKNEIENMPDIDYTNDNNFVDEECINNCYIYPICHTCYGANYMVTKDFKIRNKSKCQIQKIITLFIADLQAKRIQKDSKIIKDDDTLFYTIEAIKKIRELYLDMVAATQIS